MGGGGGGWMGIGGGGGEAAKCLSSHGTTFDHLESSKCTLRLEKMGQLKG